MTGPLDGRTVVITGARSGIGRIAARELHDRGADVVVVGRDPELTRGIAPVLGGRHLLARLDRLDAVRRPGGDLPEPCPR
uniref:SDR family NAD(P)-dependent oxidoreductase n=1 Tax=Clavibacter michiganensis TaxID=28447 RepID=UPI0029309FDE